MPQNKDGRGKNEGSRPNEFHKQMGGFDKLKARRGVPDSDDTGYISPYRRRLLARSRQDRNPANPQIGPSAEDYRVSENARKQLLDIHTSTRRKDGGRRGRSNP